MALSNTMSSAPGSRGMPPQEMIEADKKMIGVDLLEGMYRMTHQSKFIGSVNLGNRGEYITKKLAVMTQK